MLNDALARCNASGYFGAFRVLNPLLPGEAKQDRVPTQFSKPNSMTFSMRV